MVDLPLLAVTEEAESLAPLLLRAAGLAPNAETDALHMAAGDLYAPRADRMVNDMWEDPIVEETRAAREELFARFNHGLAALCRYLREREHQHPGRVVTLEPRRPELVDLAKK